MNYKENYYNNLAAAISINGNRSDIFCRQKFVAIYMLRNKIVTIGINKCKTHPLLYRYGYCEPFVSCCDDMNEEDKDFAQIFSRYPSLIPIHAEFDGYLQILKRGLDFNALYIYRGSTGLNPSKPCNVCANWLKRINGLTICYINEKGTFEMTESSKLIGHTNTVKAYYERNKK